MQFLGKMLIFKNIFAIFSKFTIKFPIESHIAKSIKMWKNPESKCSLPRLIWTIKQIIKLIENINTKTSTEKRIVALSEASKYEDIFDTGLSKYVAVEAAENVGA